MAIPSKLKKIAFDLADMDYREIWEPIF